MFNNTTKTTSAVAHSDAFSPPLHTRYNPSSGALGLQSDLGYGLGVTIRRFFGWAGHSVYCSLRPSSHGCLSETALRKLFQRRLQERLITKLDPGADSHNIGTIVRTYIDGLLPFEQEDLTHVWRNVAKQIRKQYGGYRIVNLSQSELPELEFHVIEDDYWDAFERRFRFQLVRRLNSEASSADIVFHIRAYMDGLVPFEQDHLDEIWSKVAKYIRSQFGGCKLAELSQSEKLSSLKPHLTQTDRLCPLEKALRTTTCRTHQERAQLVMEHLSLRDDAPAAFELLGQLYGEEIQGSVAARIPALKEVLESSGHYYSKVGLAGVTPRMDRDRLAKTTKLDPETPLLELISAAYPPLLIDAVGGAKSMAELPILDLAEDEGSTGYLDFVSPADMTHPVMRGVDHVGRPFLAICHVDWEGRKMVEVFFQRYAEDMPLNWARGFEGDGIPHIGHRIDYDTCEYMARLIRGEPCGLRIGYLNPPTTLSDPVRTDDEGNSLIRLCERKQRSSVPFADEMSGKSPLADSAIF